jgi:hypothetical protein
LILLTSFGGNEKVDFCRESGTSPDPILKYGRGGGGLFIIPSGYPTARRGVLADVKRYLSGAGRHAETQSDSLVVDNQTRCVFPDPARFGKVPESLDHMFAPALESIGHQNAVFYF